MSALDQPVAPRRSDESVRLWNQVVSARTLVALERHSPVGSSLATARAELLVALEAYVLSLTAHGRPIPYALRDELRIGRLTR